MYGRVIGYRELNYTSKKTGKPVHGYNVSLTFENSQYVGLQAMDVYCSVDDLRGYVPALDDEVVVLYNQYGRVCSLALR